VKEFDADLFLSRILLLLLLLLLLLQKAEQEVGGTWRRRRSSGRKEPTGKSRRDEGIFACACATTA